MSALGAQNIGAGKYDRVDKILRYAIAIGVGFGAVMALLMQFIAPGAPETGAGAAQTAAPAQTGGAPNAVEELKQYKSLLDAGVITEEEFAAKKRQLLGI